MSQINEFKFDYQKMRMPNFINESWWWQVKWFKIVCQKLNMDSNFYEISPQNACIYSFQRHVKIDISKIRVSNRDFHSEKFFKTSMQKKLFIHNHDDLTYFDININFLKKIIFNGISAGSWLLKDTLKNSSRKLVTKMKFEKLMFSLNSILLV